MARAVLFSLFFYLFIYLFILDAVKNQLLFKDGFYFNFMLKMRPVFLGFLV